jgi:hypothetical protein
MMKVVAFVAQVGLGLIGCSQHEAPKPNRYILGNGTTGWVKITYNRSDAPALPVENGVAVVRIPQDRKLSTQTRMNPTWDNAEFFYQNPDGKLEALSSKDGDKRNLWGLEKTSDTEGEREVFFVGKEALFNRATHVSGARGADLLPDVPDPTTKAADPTKVEDAPSK